MKNISLIFYPNRSKKNKLTGKYPIYARVLVGRSKSERRLPKEYDIEYSELLKWHPATMRFVDSNSFVNEYLDELSVKFRESKRNSGNQNFTAASLIGRLLNLDTNVEEQGLPSFVNRYYLTVVKTNTNYSAGTKRNYLKTINWNIQSN